MIFDIGVFCCYALITAIVATWGTKGTLGVWAIVGGTLVTVHILSMIFERKPEGEDEWL